MSLITLLSDFGQKDHYVAAVKASILRVNPALRIIDICHEIPCCDIAYASFVLQNTFRIFSKGTIHMVAVGCDTHTTCGPIVLQLEEHFFIGSNSGLFSLISSQKPAVVIGLQTFSQHTSTFIAKDIYGPAAARLASGKGIYDLGSTEVELQTLLQKKGRIHEKSMHGHVIHIDGTGNIITNLSKKDFENRMQVSSAKHFELICGKERSTTIHQSYDEVEGGESFFLFNDLGLLEIGIRYGHAARLLGVTYDTPVSITFS